ncbi:hypothetical protein ACWCPF_37585 [Streptomyces sp. NPDC001858]
MATLSEEESRQALKRFADGIDAVCHRNDGFWFFSGPYCLKHHDTSDELLRNPQLTAEVFTALPPDFAEKVDAVAHRGDGFWFFSGNRCLKYHDTAERLLQKPGLIAEIWPALKVTP